MKLLIAEEKHGTRYFEADTYEQLNGACRKLLKERVEYYEDDKKFVERVNNRIDSGASLFGLLDERSSYEYENVYLEETEDV